ncbi:LuxR C-terminal-related transcriptional regulator [Streptomyces sp. NPDC056160]|uniref:helix-turn-helix transcriptional regulator n=1 Tax=Streptomyces sp. NPDC056160 TaxID=3345731 RepID=UPI0035DE59F9
MAAALRRAVHRAPADAAPRPAEAGVLLLGQDLRLLLENPAAKLWRDELAYSGAELPIAVLEVAARGRGAALPAHGRIRGRSGRWVSVHASPLSGGPYPAPLAVTVHPAPAPEVAEVLLLAYGLTPRERDVLARVVAGLPSPAIAMELRITAATVQDHLKSVFAKTGVRSRRALVATILTCERTVSTARLPGPPPGRTPCTGRKLHPPSPVASSCGRPTTVSRRRTER